MPACSSAVMFTFAIGLLLGASAYRTISTRILETNQALVADSNVSYSTVTKKHMICKRAAQQQVMCDFPKVFTNSEWNPDAVCIDSTGGRSAGDRADWLTKNDFRNMCEEAAQAEVMCEYPNAFTDGKWNASVVCGDYLAGDRAVWWMRRSGRVMGKQAARTQVMCDFPESFANNKWNPEAVCVDSAGEYTARGRADWLMKNHVLGMVLCEQAAQEQVMWEFPAQFPDGKWNASVVCEHFLAGDRALSLMRWGRRLMGKQAAQTQVMCDFPESFTNHDWNPEAVCVDSTGKHTAGYRSHQLMKKNARDMILCEQAAQEQVMWEFPFHFPDGKWNASVICGDYLAGDLADQLRVPYGKH